LPATVGTNEFFCVSCRLAAGLDIHGRCATCGSDAVTHPLRYRLILAAADNCRIREKKVPLELSLKNSEESRRGGAYRYSGGKFWWFLSKTNLDSNQKGKKA
jgi:hypothetical protein